MVTRLVVVAIRDYLMSLDTSSPRWS